ncbi:MAG: diguanylate cyclase domain-containing protein [Vibrio sp.]|uniref:diguanylate cyclase domain-containing protein n=1 Tax=Vibrio sp. TaxID=678 RepID=UPI003A8B6FDA
MIQSCNIEIFPTLSSLSGALSRFVKQGKMGADKGCFTGELILRVWIVLLLIICNTSFAAVTPERYRIAITSGDVVALTLFQALEEKLGLEFDYDWHTSMSDTLSSVIRGEADFAANFVYLEERAGLLDFSDPTNVIYSLYFYNQPKEIDEIERVAVPYGTVYADILHRDYPNVRLEMFNSFEQAYELLNSHQVDGILTTLSSLDLLLEGSFAILVNHQLSMPPARLIAPKGRHPELLNQLAETVRGEEIQRKIREVGEFYHLNIRKQTLALQFQNSGLDVNRSYRMKVEDNALFSAFQAGGGVEGIASDIAFQACDLLHISCLLVNEWDEPWKQMYQDLQQQKIDLLLPMAITKEREQLFNFSKPYYSPNAILVKRKGYNHNAYHTISELVGERIGVLQGKFFETLLNKMLPGKTLYTYKSQPAMLQALLDNKVDYIFVTRVTFNQFLRESKQILPIEEDRAIGPVYSYNLSIGFPANEEGEKLATFFSAAMQLIDIPKIVSKYDAVPDWYHTTVKQNQAQKYNQMIFLLGLIVVMGFVVIFYRRSMIDDLTHLKNRRALNFRYRRGVSNNLLFVYLDINKFKSINDTYGHQIGDSVLKQLAKQIKRHWPGQAYRIGGDEFILVAKLKSAPSLADICEFYFANEQRGINMLVKTSAGVVAINQDMSLDAALNLADVKMYQHKKGLI